MATFGFFHAPEEDSDRDKYYHIKDVDVKNASGVNLGFSHPKGYANCKMHVYVMDLLTRDIHDYHFEEENIKHRILFPYTCKGKVDIYIHFTDFNTDPPQWMYTAEAYEEIRNNPTPFLKNLKDVNDLIQFVKSFIRIRNGSYHYSAPVLKPEDFSSSDIDKIDKLIYKAEWKVGANESNYEPGTLYSVLYFFDAFQSLVHQMPEEEESET